MDKKIGKLSFVLFLFCNLFADQNVSLKIVTMQGKRAKKIAVGKPFVIKAKVSGQTSALPEVKIEGLNQFDSKNTQVSQQITTVNGETTVEKEYNIFVQMDKEGELTVGPAIIIVDGKEKKTEPVTILITAEDEEQDKNYKEAFLELEGDKKELFCGEPFLVHIRFYYDDESIRIEGIQEPSFEGFTTQGIGKPKNGKKIINDTEYSYLEWSTTLYPEHSGNLVVPVIKGVYSTPSSSNQSFWNLFHSGRQERKKVIYTNPLKVTVHPLPEHDPEIKSIGSFSSLSLHLTNTKITQGEGIVLNLFIQGDGNLLQISHPELEVPDGITYYNSKSKLVTNGKVFEYILQGSDPDNYTIEPQSFTYFDTGLKKYKTILSNKVTLSVAPGEKKEVFISQDAQPTDNIEAQEEQEEVFSILEHGQWRNSYERVFPWFWFFVLMAFPSLTYCIVFLKKKRDAYLEKNAPIERYNKAFVKAKETLRAARKGNYDGQIYHMFITLFASRLKIKRSEVSEELIEATLKNAGVTDEKIIAWRLLFAQLTETAFSSHRIGDNKDGIFNKTAHWLTELEKLI